MLLLFSGYGLDKSCDLTLGPEKLLEFSVNELTVFDLKAWVKVFKIIPEFRILRMTFHRKSSSKS